MSISGLKVSVFLVSLLPAAALIYGVLNNTLGANPIETLTRDTGVWALRFLLLTLCITPLRALTRWHWLATIRRMLGLYSFFYASIHMLLYLWLDQFFVFSDIVKDIIERPFITVGFISFVTLIPLAMTSNQAMINRLGTERWNKLHRWVYYISIATVIHFFMLVKQDITEPVYYASILAVLLGFRIYRYAARSLISV